MMLLIAPLLALTFQLVSLANHSSGEVRDVQADLIKAIEQRDLSAATTALDRGAKANVSGAFHRTPLHVAAKQSTSEIVSLLLARGADVNARDDDGRTPLHLANSMSAELLLAHHADAAARDKQGNTPLHTAAEQDGPAMCRLLVAAGVNVDAKNSAGLTPLHFAALQGQRGVAEYLLGQHANINARTFTVYQYKWSYLAWDAHGMEVPVDAGATPISIARARHKKNKFSSGRFGELAEFLKSKGAVEKSGWWPFG